MADNLGRFNRTFKEFVDDLITVFPNDTQFRMVKLTIGAMLMASPNMLYEGYRDRVALPYGEKILAHDEGFFMDANFNEQTTDIEDAGKVIDRIKQMYRTMNETNRAVVWKYMRVLTLLSNKISAGTA